MMERRRIVGQWERGSAEVLVTLVRVEGSSYRQPGARLLLGEGGKYAGTISGGCLEAEVIRKARWAVREGARVQRYSTLFDDTAELPFGLGCGGVIDLLLEPADTPEARALRNALLASLAGETLYIRTRLPENGTPLARIVLAGDGTVRFRSEGLEEAESTGSDHPGWFTEQLVPPQRLVIFGAGDDAIPVARMAAGLGWDVLVADRRRQLLQAERFPEAERRVATTDVRAVGVRSVDAVVLMTHSYEQDRDLLEALLPVRPCYLGLLGARHRSSLLVTEAAARLRRSVASCCEQISAPVGLDVGGEGAEAIALAIVAEAHAAVHARPVAGRRLTAEEVERNIARGGDAGRYLAVRCAVGSSE